MTTIAVCNLNGAADSATNLSTIDGYAAEAKRGGASVLLLPENCCAMPANEADRNALTEAFGDGPLQKALAAIAARHGLWLVAGSLPLLRDSGPASPERPLPEPLLPEQVLVVWDDQGRRIQHYAKVHLFDTQLANGEGYCESGYTQAGDRLALCDSPLGVLGLSICFDMRFAEQYRLLCQRGAQVLLAPAAFTATTGAVHWHTLLRARAIENQAYMAASAQTGLHASGRRTYGHAVVYDPWGECLVDLGDAPGVGFATIDPHRIESIRSAMPLRHHRWE